MASILGFLAAMGPLCTDLYLPALPNMAEELSSSASQMQLSITACLLGLSLGQIVLGPLSDARGRRLPLLFPSACSSQLPFSVHAPQAWGNSLL